MVNVQGYYYWNILKIYESFLESLVKIKQMVPRIDSIAVCTWGIDFALYKDGFMLSNPLSYRNTIGENSLQKLNEAEKRDLFYETGILCDRINSIYMLLGIKNHMPGLYNTADKILMVPDIFNYMLTGKMQNEPSEFSTTQLMNVRSFSVSHEVCSKVNISEELFCEIGVHGKIIGHILPEIREKIGVDYDIPVVCVPSHDTAAAVFAIPAEEKEFAFVSSGTWSLIGTEISEPIINDETLNNGFTNEVGAFKKITLLKNSAGMFIIQRIRKELQEAMGEKKTWDEIVEMAKKYTGKKMVFDVNALRFFNPPNMSKEIYSFLQESGQMESEFDWGAIIRTVYESMACSYAVAFENLEEITKIPYEKVYIVGGGNQNRFLNQLIADRTGKTIVTCSKEAK